MRRVVWLWLALGAWGCRGEAPVGDGAGGAGEVKAVVGVPAGAPVADPGPLLTRPTGERAALVRSAVRLEADAVETFGGGVWVRASVPSDPLVLVDGLAGDARLVVRGDRAGLAVPANEGRGVDRPFLFVRLAGEAAPPSEVVVEWFQPALLEGEPGRRQVITVGGVDRAEVFSGLGVRGLRAASRWFFGRAGSGAFWAFAGGRLGAMASEGGPARSRQASPFDGMALWGGDELWTMLMADRGWRAVEPVEVASVAVGEAPAGAAVARPWDELLAGAKVEVEAVARWAPVEFVYLALFEPGGAGALGEALAGAWGPLGVVTGVAREEVVAWVERYRAQLGLSGDWGALGASSAAVVTSDPVLWEGSDVTVVFVVGSAAAAEAVLAGWEAEARARVGAVEVEMVTLGGQAVRWVRSGDRALSQLRVAVGDVVVVGNSPAAVARVLAAGAGEGSLADSGGLRYFRSVVGGAPAGGAFLFVSDEARAAVASARSRVLRMRRRWALASLRAVGFAELLGGWLAGRSVSEGELAGMGVRVAGDRVLDDGSVVAGEAPGCSAVWGCAWWGRPLIELPLEAVTERERGALARRVDEARWLDEYVGPLGVWASARGGAVEVRFVMAPLAAPSGFDRWLELGAGAVRADVGSGAAVVVSVGPRSELRAEAEGWLVELSGRRDVGLSWLGDWVAVGAADRSGLWDAALALGEIPNQEGRRRWRDVALRKRVLDRLPVWVAAGVADEAALMAALAGARAMLMAVTEGAVSWGPGAPYRGVATTEVRETLTEAAEAQVGLVFAVVGKTWVVSLDRGALEEVIDAVLAGRLPGAGASGGATAGASAAGATAGASAAGASAAGASAAGASAAGASAAGATAWAGPEGDGARVAVAVRPVKGGWLQRALLGVMEGASVGRIWGARRGVEAVAVGLGSAWPAGEAEREAALVRFGGEVPRGPHGRVPVMDGGVPRHPLYGIEAAPIWPKVPIGESALSQAIEGLGGLEVTLGGSRGAPHGRVWGRLRWERRE